jgi:DNA processing protein
MGCSDCSRQWLEILSIGNVGAARWLQLRRTRPLAEIVEMARCVDGRCELGRLIGRKVRAPDRRFVRTQLETARRLRCAIVSIEDRRYPGILREIHAPPPLLFCSGDCSILSRPAVCIVGSRNASRRGRIVARHLARELARRDLSVISGMARGIDTAAHTGALDGGGGTCAVLGCGVDVPYPPENASLAVSIAGSGCVISEFPFGVQPLRHHFPRRNRILSGLSLGVVVVEAGLSSGAMNTAQWAVEQNREVFAVPGPVEHAGSRGPHRLIREGARLVEDVGDIIGELPPCGTAIDPIPLASAGNAAASCGAGRLSEHERRVIRTLELDPKHVDELVQICNISATSILPLLLDLELRGVVESCGAGRYALADRYHAAGSGTRVDEADESGRANR